MEYPENLVAILEKFGLAILLSGVIGLERQRKARGAGLRTHILVCLGSTMLMVLSEYLGHEDAAIAWVDSGRIAAGIITGIGFLGAGTIVTVGGEHRGLTTAAMVWFVAALGIAIGAGMRLVATCATALALITVIGLEYVEEKLPMPEHFSLKIKINKGLEVLERIEARIRKEGFDVVASRIRVVDSGEQIEITFEIKASRGHPIERLVEILLADFALVEAITFER